MSVPQRSSRSIGDFVAFAGGALVLLFALMVFDHRIRDHVTATIGDGHGPSELAGVGQQAGDLAMVVALVVVQFVREQSLANVHLAVFLAAGVMLFAFFVRL